jgi:putative transposase
MTYYHRRSIRLKGFDYSQNGYYFITTCTYQRQEIFGNISKHIMQLNPIGDIARNEWLKTPLLRKNVVLDEFVIMPNHVHGIIILDSVGAYCNTPLQNINTFTSPSNTIGAIIRGYKSSVTNQINILNHSPNHPVWQRNYYEHIIRNEKQYWAIKQYIQDNVKNWEKDEMFNPSSTLP